MHRPSYTTPPHRLSPTTRAPCSVSGVYSGVTSSRVRRASLTGKASRRADQTPRPLVFRSLTTSSFSSRSLSLAACLAQNYRVPGGGGMTRAPWGFLRSRGKDHPRNICFSLFLFFSGQYPIESRIHMGIGQSPQHDTLGAPLNSLTGTASPCVHPSPSLFPAPLSSSRSGVCQNKFERGTSSSLPYANPARLSIDSPWAWPCPVPALALTLILFSASAQGRSLSRFPPDREEPGGSFNP